MFGSGDIVVAAKAAVGISIAVETEAEVERLSLGHLIQAGRDYVATAWATARSDNPPVDPTVSASTSKQSMGSADSAELDALDAELTDESPSHARVNIATLLTFSLRVAVLNVQAQGSLPVVRLR
jgi:hypothetical protein